MTLSFPTPSGRGADMISRTAVLVPCGRHLLAFKADEIERIALPHHLQRVRLSPRGAPVACLGTVRLQQQRYVAWDLGRMLELDVPGENWSVLHIDHEGTPLPLALRMPTCSTVVQFADDPMPLPGALTESRPDAIHGLLKIRDESAGGQSGQIRALLVDTRKLWRFEELDAAAAILVDD
jgi:hypothetical protein